MLIRGRTRSGSVVTALLTVVMMFVHVSDASAHRDSIDGPVVRDAAHALENGDLAPVLKWVRAEDEEVIRTLFGQVREVRTQGPTALELADRHFFETVVRLHRESEGEPYTGLKPAGTDPGIVVRTADAALKTGTLDEMNQLLTESVRLGLNERFTRMKAAHELRDENPAAGRRFVEAYVDFVHYARHVFEVADAGTKTKHASH